MMEKAKGWIALTVAIVLVGCMTAIVVGWTIAALRTIL